ncbi:MAG: response regulator [Anaerolineae bacterium]
MKDQTLAMVIARPGQVRDSLQVLLTAIPQIDAVLVVDDGPAALDIGMKNRSALVLLDFDLPKDEAWVTLQQIKTAWPRTQCIALVDHEQEQEIAKAAGADVALIKGILAARLGTTIEELLIQQEA